MNYLCFYSDRWKEEEWKEEKWKEEEEWKENDEEWKENDAWEWEQWKNGKWKEEWEQWKKEEWDAPSSNALSINSSPQKPKSSTKKKKKNKWNQDQWKEEEYTDEQWEEWYNNTPEKGNSRNKDAHTHRTIGIQTECTAHPKHQLAWMVLPEGAPLGANLEKHTSATSRNSPKRQHTPKKKGDNSWNKEEEEGKKGILGTNPPTPAEESWDKNESWDKDEKWDESWDKKSWKDEQWSKSDKKSWSGVPKKNRNKAQQPGKVNKYIFINS